MPTRAYIRIDPGFYERKALDQKYPAGAVAALVGCLCLGESQPQRGRFRDRRVLAVLLGPQARWIPFLIEKGDLVERDELPRLYIDGWHEWQEGDVTVPERMARLRHRREQRTVGVTAPVTPDVTVPVTTPRSDGGRRSGGGGGSGGADKSGGGSPSNGAPRPGYANGPERLPGEAPVPKHEGQHEDCLVCEPIRAAAAAVTPTPRPREAKGA